MKQSQREAFARLTRKTNVDWVKVREKAQEAMKVGLADLISHASRATALKPNQTKRRIKLAKGRRVSSARPGVFAKIGTGTDAAKVHPGRTPLVAGGFAGKYSVVAGGVPYHRAFLWNPKGKKLRGEHRRVYRRQKILGAQRLKAVTHKFNLRSSYKARGKSVLYRVMRAVFAAARNRSKARG